MTTKIIDPDNDTGTDYLSLNAWEAWLDDGDLTEIEYGQCRASSGSADTTAVNFIVVTTAAFYIQIERHSSESHSGKWDTNNYRLELATTNILYARSPHMRCDGIQIGSTEAAVSYMWNARETDACDHRITNCIFRSGGNTDHAGYNDSIGVGNGSVVRIWNCLFYGFETTDSGTRCIYANDTSNTPYIYNNTVDGGYYGIRLRGSSIDNHVKNNVSINGNTPYYDVTAGNATNNGYDSGSDPGSNGIDLSAEAETDLFEDYSASPPIYRVKDSNSALYQAGADLDGDAGIAVTTDWEGDSRHASTPCIGCDELVAAGGLEMELVMHHYKQMQGN